VTSDMQKRKARQSQITNRKLQMARWTNDPIPEIPIVYGSGLLYLTRQAGNPVLLRFDARSRLRLAFRKPSSPQWLRVANPHPKRGGDDGGADPFTTLSNGGESCQRNQK
jgi:hypothetical protein